MMRFVTTKQSADGINYDDNAVKDEINIGDWCVFQDKSKVLVGQIVGFNYIEGKRKQYTFDCCPI
jgi:hypothetical protein